MNAPRSELPPLRIHHLLAWMTVTAVVISLSLWFDHTARNGPSIQNEFAIVALIALAICVSGALLFAGWGLYWRAKDFSFPAEPGQWLLVEIAAAAVAMLLWVLGTFVVFIIEEDFMMAFQITFGIAAIVALIVLNCYVAGWRCDARVWSALFGYLAAFPFLSVALGIAWEPLVEVLKVIGVLLLLSATAIDWRLGQRRHWTHWLGIALSLVIAMITFAPAS